MSEERHRARHLVHVVAGEDHRAVGRDVLKADELHGGEVDGEDGMEEDLG